MTRLYLLVYSNLFGDREFVKKILDDLPEVIKWRYDIPNCFYFTSHKSARELMHLFLEHKPSREGRFLITEINKNFEGMLSPKTWDFFDNCLDQYINNKKI